MTGAREVVEQADFSVEDYYDGSCELIDSNEYRERRGIRVLTGEIFDLKGRVDQSFETSYSERGEIVRSRAVFADGQVIEKILGK